ncbi:MAG: hypothetical protein WC003_10975 [Terrimicrobiaceae bacterium]
MGSHTTGSREAAGKPAAGSPSGHDLPGSGMAKVCPPIGGLRADLGLIRGVEFFSGPAKFLLA